MFAFKTIVALAVLAIPAFARPLSGSSQCNSDQIQCYDQGAAGTLDPIIVAAITSMGGVIQGPNITIDLSKVGHAIIQIMYTY